MGNSVSEARADIRVLKALIATDTPVTWPVLNAVWRWFLDVEIVLPIPVMDLSDGEKKALATDVINDLDESFGRLEAQVDADPETPMEGNVEVQHVNALWRELAGIYAPMVNDSVQEVPEEIRPLIMAQAVTMLAQSSGLDMEDAIEHVRTDPVVRMMLRRSGIDPDDAIRHMNNRDH